MNIRTRLALSSDIEGIFDVRTSVKENYLSREEMELMGITESSVIDMIEKSRCAWVAVDDGKVIGFSMIILDEGSLFAAFVLPEYEGRGVGRSLVELAEQELFKHHEVASSAFRTMSFVIRDCMDQPIILRENRSTTTARYSQPSWVLM